jgi:hypothetical protein
MSAATIHNRLVQSFTDSVRAALKDLPQDEIDELTDGLEASLADRLDDQGGELGDPAAYAADLRAAAGLPSRGNPIHGSAGSILSQAVMDAAAAFRELYGHPAVRKIGAFLVSLRPLWWLFRAFVLYVVLTAIFGLFAQVNMATFCIGAGAFIVSVQFGRGKWLPRRWMKRALMVVNVLMVIAVPIVILAASELFGQQYDTAYAAGASDESTSQLGLYYDGRQVTNILPYDASGHALSDVQLFDQNGKPLYTVADPRAATSDDIPDLVPNKNVVGRLGWNVYPLLEIPQSEMNTDTGSPEKGAVAVVPKHEHDTVPGLADQPAPTSSPTPKP